MMRRTKLLGVVTCAWGLATGCGMGICNDSRAEIESMAALENLSACTVTTGQVIIQTLHFKNPPEEIHLPNLLHAEQGIQIDGAETVKRISLPALIDSGVKASDDGANIQIDTLIRGDVLTQVDLSALTRVHLGFSIDGPVTDLNLGPLEDLQGGLGFSRMEVGQIEIPTLTKLGTGLGLSDMNGLALFSIPNVSWVHPHLITMSFVRNVDLGEVVIGGEELPDLVITENEGGMSLSSPDALAMGSLDMEGNNGVVSLSVKGDAREDSLFRITDNTGLTSLSAPDVTRLHTLHVKSNPDLQTLSFPQLTQMDQRLNIVDNPRLPNCQAKAIADAIAPNSPFIPIIYSQNLDDECPNKES
jgi:hypothetical protein